MYIWIISFGRPIAQLGLFYLCFKLCDTTNILTSSSLLYSLAESLVYRMFGIPHVWYAVLVAVWYTRTGGRRRILGPQN